MHTAFLFHHKLSPTYGRDLRLHIPSKQKPAICNCKDSSFCIYRRKRDILSAHTKHGGFGFIKFCKFTMKRQMLLEIIGLSAFWVTEILTANRLLSDTAEEADFLNGLTLAVH